MISPWTLYWTFSGTFKTHGITRISKAYLYFNPSKKGEVKLKVSKEKWLLQGTPDEEMEGIFF
jgi:hypothetical protein